MLQSVVEQKMALAHAAYGSDGSIPVLSSTLDIANKFIDTLSPVEEIIQTISEDKHAYLSLSLWLGY